MAKAPRGQGWFRVRHCLIQHPRVVRIAQALGDTEGGPSLSLDERINLTIGALCRVWSMGNTHADTLGRIDFATVDTVSNIARVDGFGDAMEAVGWLQTCDGGVLLPNFAKHNRTTAPAEVVGRGPSGDPDDTANGADDTPTDTNDTVDTVATGVSMTEEQEQEQEREQEQEVSSIDPLYISPQECQNRTFALSTDPEPESAAARTRRIKKQVAEIWAVWPRKDNKRKGEQAIYKVLDGGFDFADLLRRVRLYATGRPTSRSHPDYAYTPHPSTWFNQRRFEDDEFDEGRSVAVNPFDVDPEE